MLLDAPNKPLETRRIPLSGPHGASLPTDRLELSDSNVTSTLMPAPILDDTLAARNVVCRCVRASITSCCEGLMLGRIPAALGGL